MPVHVNILSTTINTYSLCIVIAVMTGVAWALATARDAWRTFSTTLNALVIGAVATFVIGRAGYVLLNLTYFQEHPSEIVSTASPGLWEQAAIAGWLLGWLVAHRLRQDTPAMNYVVLATLAGIGASIGCVALGCGYGREVYWTDGWPWQLRVDWPDAYLINNPRLPAQDFMIVWLAICLVAVWVATARHWRIARAGRALLLWALLFSIGDFALQFIRADAVPVLGPLRAPQWADIALAAGCGIALGGSVLSCHNNSPRRFM
jgi:phosphatidylglycerol:prolipoprotein diacylglycerol transferase